MFLLAISPLVPLGLIAVVGGGAYALYRWARGEPTPVPPGPVPPGPEPSPGPAPGPAPSPTPSGDKDPLRCKQTGERYDPVRWSGPAAVQGGLIRLGYYAVGPTLVTKSDVELIKGFQRKARELKLGPYAKAPNSWIHGRMGPCTLISLSAAEALLYAGKWPGA